MDPQAPNPYMQQQPRGNALAVASLICGLVGLLLFGIILGPLAIIFGAIGLSNANKNPIGAGKGAAIAGLVLGCVDLLIVFVFIGLVMR
jgi:hypothetical protein